MMKNPKFYVTELLNAQVKRLFDSKGAERKGQALFNALYEAGQSSGGS